MTNGRRARAVTWHVALLLTASLCLAFAPVPGHSVAAARVGAPTAPCGRPGAATPAGGFPRILHIGMQPTDVAVSERTGHVFVINRGEQKLYGKLVCRSSLTTLDASTGRFIRTWPLSEVPVGMIVDDRDHLVFVASAFDPNHRNMSFGYLNVFDTNGRGARGGIGLHLRWGDLYAIGVDEATHRLFVVTHRAVMTINTLSTNQMTTVAIEKIGYGSIGGGRAAVSVQLGRVFIPTASGVAVIDSVTGSVVATINLGEAERGLALDVQTGRLFVETVGTDAACRGGPTDHLAVLDARTGAMLRTVLDSCAPFSPLIVDERAQRVVVATLSSALPMRVAILNARDGRLLRYINADPGLLRYSTVDGRTGRIYYGGTVCTGRPVRCFDAVKVLDPTGWTVVRSVPVAHATSSILAIAEKARRVFLTQLYFDTVAVVPT